MVKFPVVSFIIELEPKMLSVYDGQTYLLREAAKKNFRGSANKRGEGDEVSKGLVTKKKGLIWSSKKSQHKSPKKYDH